MKKWISILSLSLLFFSNQIHSESEKIQIVVLNFVNKTNSENKEAYHYDFLGKKIADEFRFVLSKSEQIQIFSAEPLYEQILGFQKSGQDSGETKIISFLERYENKTNAKPFTHILMGEFTVQENQIIIQIQLKKRNEKTLDVQNHIEKDFPELNKSEYWQLNSCSKAVFLAEKQFGIIINDGYTRTCAKPIENSLILESSKKVISQMKEIEKEVSSLQKSNKSCPNKCAIESDEEKMIACLQSCEVITNIKRQNLELSRISFGGYVDTEDTPRNMDSSVQEFKNNYLSFILETLKQLPSNASLIVQGRISKKHSSDAELFQKSKQKAEKAKELISKEILNQDKDAGEYLKKIKIEACGDICFQEYPNQLDSSGKDNDVTFIIRVIEKK